MNGSTYDIVILDAGSGGYVTTLCAAQSSMKVALIDGDKVSGTCLHRDRIPTKTHLHAAETAETVRKSPKFDVSSTFNGIGMARVGKYHDSVILGLCEGLQGLLKSHNVEMISGQDRLVDANTIEVNGQRITGHNIVPATGSYSHSIPGLEIDGRVISSDQALQVDWVPFPAVIPGGGVTGLEFVSAWRSFDTEITIIEALPHPANNEDEAISKQPERACRKYDIKSHMSTRLASAMQNGQGVHVMTEDGKAFDADVLLIAVGHGSAIKGLSYRQAGIILGRDFVITNDRLYTGVGNIYAADGIVPSLQLVHRGFIQGIFVAEEIAGLNPTMQADISIPRVTFYGLEIASVGTTEKQTREELGDQVRTIEYNLTDNGKSSILAILGIIKLVSVEDGPTAGFRDIDARTDEQIGEGEFMMNWEAYPSDVTSLIHAHPSQNGSPGEVTMALAGEPLHVHNRPNIFGRRAHMTTSVTMSALGKSIIEGTVTTWLERVDNTIELDEPIVEASTDKIGSEVPSFVADALLEILVPEDEIVEVGAEIACIGDASEILATPATAPADTPVGVPVAPVTAPVETAIAPASTPTQGTEVRMPALGESVTEGTVTTWLKSVGNAADVDESLFEVSTNKVDFETPSPAVGFLAEIRTPEDKTVEVDTVVTTISSLAPSAAPVAETTAPATLMAPTVPAAPVAPAVPAVPVDPFPNASTLVQTVSAAPVVKAPIAVAGFAYVAPIARKLTRELGADLASVSDTGVSGRVRREDTEATAAAARAVAAIPVAPTASAAPTVAQANTVRESLPLRGTTEKMSRLYQIIARRIVESLQTMARLTTVIEADVTKIAALCTHPKDALSAKHGTKLTFLPFFAKVTIEAFIYHPKIDATISDREVMYFDYEHVSIAIDTPCSLLIPIIKNTGDRNIAGIAASIDDLAARTRESKIGSGELFGSTFTVTNTDSSGALFDTSVLNTPETVIMDAGTIMERPAVMKGADGADVIAIRSMVYLPLSYDHHLVDGADTSRFLTDVKGRLEEGVFEADLGLWSSPNADRVGLA